MKLSKSEREQYQMWVIKTRYIPLKVPANPSRKIKTLTSFISSSITPTLQLINLRLLSKSNNNIMTNMTNSHANLSSRNLATGFLTTLALANCLCTPGSMIWWATTRWWCLCLLRRILWELLWRDYLCCLHFCLHFNFVNFVEVAMDISILHAVTDSQSFPDISRGDDKFLEIF